jgi:hypothetical protein
MCQFLPLGRIALLSVFVAACARDRLIAQGPSPQPAAKETTASRAAAPDKRPNSSPVLKRIFHNWKTRRERVTSLHFVWDQRLIFRSTRPDPNAARGPGGRKSREELYTRELWSSGDVQMCLDMRERPAAPQPTAVPNRGVVRRETLDGTLASVFWQSQVPNFVCVPEAWIHREKGPDGLGLNFIPIVLTYRTQRPWRPWSEETCRLVTENAIIDGVRYVKIERPADADGFRGVDTCWVDPSREDLVVAWEMRRTGENSYPNCHGTCEYKRDPAWGWMPHRWTNTVVVGTRDVVSESEVVKYELNKPIPAEKFAPHFPPNTYVADRANDRCYVTQPDGSKRTLTDDEFSRLTKPKPIQ